MKHIRAALSLGAACAMVHTGIAIYRYPAHAAVVFAILTVFSLIGGASAWEVAHATLAFTVIVGLIFIIALGCHGRWFAAYFWFMALLISMVMVRAGLDYVAMLSVNGYLSNYHWWLHHSSRWLPSPAEIAITLPVMLIPILKDIFSTDQSKPRREDRSHNPSTERQKSAVPSYEEVRLVAVVLSRISLQLIEKHFQVSSGVAGTYMARLVAEGHFGEISVDGWYYPITRRQRPRRSSAKKGKAEPKVADRVEPNPDRPVSDDRLGKRIGELDQEILAQKDRVKRLQSAGKTVIAQREKWKAQALGAEQRVTDLIAQLASRPETRDGRFDALRRLVAKELHPDFCDSGGLEKTLRAEFFKKLWPEIERLTEQ
jgi:hypothetical protein